MLSLFFRSSIFCVLRKHNSYLMSAIDNSILQSLQNRVLVIERQIGTLSAELKDIKRVLSAHNISTSSVSKKRRHEDSDRDDVEYGSNSESNVNFTKDINGYVQVFTDGACENNGKANAKAGLGVWFGHNHPLNVSEPVKRRPTNNVGEIEGCTRAIQVAHDAGVKKICINTDSEFVINCITKWMHGWKKNGWKTSKGAAVLNKDELIELDNTMKLMDDVKWQHVRGHRGIEGNENADMLARKGAAHYKR